MTAELVHLDKHELDRLATAAQRFHRYEHRFMRLYEAAEYDESLAVARSAAHQCPDRAATTAFWLACAYSRLNDVDEALTSLESATAEGLWWEQRMLRFGDLRPLCAQRRFSRVVERCQRLQVEANGAAAARAVVCDVSRTDAAPIMCILHGRGVRAEFFATHWRAAMDHDLVLVFPQSPRMFGHGLYCWDDLRAALSHVLAGIADVREQLRIRSRRLVLAGYAQGASVALAFALRQAVPGCTGVIAIGPTFGRHRITSDIEQFLAGIPNAAGLRTAVLTGARHSSLAETRRLCGRLSADGFPLLLDVDPDVGDEMSPTFADRLAPALRFVIEAS